MARYVYPAILEPEGGLYNVRFPDLPGCYTCGDDLTDALHMAADGLGGWLSRAEDKCAPIPAASAIKAVSAPAGASISLIVADTDAYRNRHKIG